MITFLEGTIREIEGNVLTVVAGGIGYGVVVIEPKDYVLGAHATLFIRTHWHQEDGPQLFGFKVKEERIIFDLIISCSGIGPKIAISCLETMKPGLFVSAVAERDIKALSSVPGIGAKKAEGMILHLKDKVAKLIDEGFAQDTTGALGVFKDLTGVLLSLGYGQKEITPAVNYARSQLPVAASFDECLKKALHFLAKN